jgi:hypothetical protein
MKIVNEPDSASRWGTTELQIRHAICLSVKRGFAKSPTTETFRPIRIELR